MVAFKADLVKPGKVRLTWSEENPGSLESIQIQRSGDGIHFQVIGVCRQPVNFNYTYMDETAVVGPFYYRLQLRQNSGEITCSEVCKLLTPFFRAPACQLFLLF